MPELPEVETTCRAIAPYVVGQAITDVVVRDRRLRWPVPRGLRGKLLGHKTVAVERRAKYLLLRFAHGTLIMHLGMSGSLRIVTGAQAPAKHDHLDLEFQSGVKLRLRDPRRFGSVLWTSADPMTHSLLAGLGPEPFGSLCSGAYLYDKSRGRKQALKNFIMDSRIIVGVGNIYASEALFRAGIRPQRRAGKITQQECARLIEAIRAVLRAAISAGGTTLRDYVSGIGQPGYFAVDLQVYDRAGKPCPKCGRPIKQTRIGQRSAFFCGKCQT